MIKTVNVSNEVRVLSEIRVFTSMIWSQSNDDDNDDDDSNNNIDDDNNNNNNNDDDRYLLDDSLNVSLGYI